MVTYVWHAKFRKRVFGVPIGRTITRWIFQDEEKVVATENYRVALSEYTRLQRTCASVLNEVWPAERRMRDVIYLGGLGNQD